mgnify:CR=1 FL=1
METPTPQDIRTVTSLNREARALLEHGLGLVWVEAEISNLARPASGHLYFTLKDSQAQVRCAFFRQRQRGQAAAINNGAQVMVRARISQYEARGDYQLIVEHVEPAGRGALQKQFEVLKAKLAAEGLFNAQHKRELPPYPRRIGIVTSASGAALRDVLTVLRRRLPAVGVIVYAASVQGAEAPTELKRALHKASYRAEVDVILLTRGGGSIEDLAAFNDEALARAIADCTIPIVSGVGHETDITIADFVADVRAPTPSAAAELAVPDGAMLLRQIDKLGGRMRASVMRRNEQLQQRADQLTRRLQISGPSAKLQRQQLRHAGTRAALHRLMRERLAHTQAGAVHLTRRLYLQNPRQKLTERRKSLAWLTQRLLRAQKASYQSRQQSLASLARALHTVSPLATLTRGYAIVTEPAAGKPVTRVAAVSPGEDIAVRLQDGSLTATVKQKNDDD